MRAQGAAAFLLAAAIGVNLPQLALAHAALVRSTPAARATLSRVPARVELWFNERLEPAYSSLSVQNASGLPVDQRDVTVVERPHGRHQGDALAGRAPGGDRPTDLLRGGGDDHAP